nr:putative reverse transcriptase domain-containing protein [Tanacetum cinerariifolium]
MRFGKHKKLSPRYIKPFMIIARVGPVAYALELPEELKGIHSTFHVSNLKKYLADGDIVVLMDEIQLDDKLHMIEEPVETIVERLKNNKDAHEDYLKKTIENTNTVRGLIEHTRKQNPSEPLLDSASVTPMNKVKKVRFSEPLTSSSNTHKQDEGLVLPYHQSATLFITYSLPAKIKKSIVHCLFAMTRRNQLTQTLTPTSLEAIATMAILNPPIGQEKRRVKMNWIGHQDISMAKINQGFHLTQQTQAWSLSLSEEAQDLEPSYT